MKNEYWLVLDIAAIIGNLVIIYLIGPHPMPLIIIVGLTVVAGMRYDALSKKQDKS